MGRYLHFLFLPLSRALRDAAGDPNMVWELLGLREWSRSPKTRAVLDRHPELLDEIRKEFANGFEPPGTLDLSVLESFASRAMDTLNLSSEDTRALSPFREIHLINATGFVVGWLVFFEAKVRPLWRIMDEGHQPDSYELHDTRLRPGTLDDACLIPATTLRETNIDALRETVKAGDPYTLKDLGWTIEPIIAVLREARDANMDVVVTFG
jgi:hypothetical protein